MEKMRFSNENLNINNESKVSVKISKENNNKTPEQKEVLNNVINFINEHLISIGLSPKNIDDYNVSFNEFQDKTTGGYYNHEKIGLEYHSSNNVHILIHEMIHHFASDDFQKIKSKKRIKTGFSSVWIDKEKKIFESLNEAITEKISREIISKNLEYVKKEADKANFDEHLKNDFESNLLHIGKDILENEKYKETEEYKNGLIEIENKIKEESIRLKDIYHKKINYYMETGNVLVLPKEIDARSFHLIVLEEHPEYVFDENKKPILKKEKRFEILKNAWEEDLNSKIEKFKKDNLELYDNKFKNRYKIATGYFNDDSIVRRKNNLNRKLFEQPLRPEGYESEIKMLDILISGIAHNAQKEKPEIKEADVWKELQKAYFNGQTVWLRKIDDVFGKNILRMIGELRPNEEEKTDQILDILSKKLEEIKNKYFYNNTNFKWNNFIPNG